MVVLANVLEHAWDPVQMLAEVRPPAAAAGRGLDFLSQRRQPLAPGVRAGLGQLACAVSPLALFPGHPGKWS